MYILKTIYKGSLNKIIHFMMWLILYSLNNLLNFNNELSSLRNFYLREVFVLFCFLYRTNLSHLVVIMALVYTFHFKALCPILNILEMFSIFMFDSCNSNHFPPPKRLKLKIWFISPQVVKLKKIWLSYIIPSVTIQVLFKHDNVWGCGYEIVTVDLPHINSHLYHRASKYKGENFFEC